jgi:Zn-dependent protease with chaperone function
MHPALLALALAALLPLGTARLLAAVFLQGAPPAGEERARRLLPFRLAALFVGFAQIQLAWMAGARASGTVGGALAAAVAFLAGGVGRRIEDPPGDRSTVLGALVLRARLLPWFAGTAAAALLSAALPVVAEGEGAAARAVHWGWVAPALLVSAFGAAYGGLLASVLLRALRPAGAAASAIAREVAAREGTSLRFVLRLPTRGARFANAAAIPWARAMVVSDRLVELLTPDELRAVLAHEAGHLSEPPRVVAARLGSAAFLLFALTTGPRIAEALGVHPLVAGGAAVALGLGVLGALRRVARGMEERADAHASVIVGAAPLAEALRKLHADGQMPLVTGSRRVHPDLYDRLTALGVDPGPRPAPPPRNHGLVVGLALGGAILLAGLQLVAFVAGERG